MKYLRQTFALVHLQLVVSAYKELNNINDDTELLLRRD